MHKYRKRKIFVLALILIMILIGIYNSYIWSVEIDGEFSMPIEEIKELLESENVKIGAKKRELDIDLIKLNVALKRDDISWIGIKLKGTTAVVRISEKSIVEKIDNSTPCNFVANKSGIVNKIFVRQGMKVVDVGQEVKEGDVLISGIMSSNFSEDRYVHADGEVEVKTWYSAKIKIPYERDVISKTKNKERKYALKIGNYKINFLNSDTKYERYDKIVSVNGLNIMDLIILPIEVEQTLYEEIDVETIKYTKEQAENIAKNEAMNQVLKLVPNSNKIQDNFINVIHTADGVQVEVTLECIENIGTKEKLEG